MAGGMAAVMRERPRPDWVRRRPGAWRYAVGTVCFGAFMGQLDASIVTLTYDPLQRQFGASLAAVQWVSLVYLLTLVALLVPIGRVSDSQGRKLLYLWGFAVFTAASAACCFAPSLQFLLAARVIQAIGAALLQANSVALVVTSAPPGKVRTALGVQAGAQAIGLALGPTIGGLMVSTVGWRWVFGVNIPIGIVAVIAGFYLLPRTAERSAPHRLDWPSVGLLAASTSALLLALSVLSGLSWPWWTAGILLVLSVATGLLMAKRQTQIPQPLIDPVVMQTPDLLPGLAGALGGYLVLFGPLVLVPIALTARGMSALTAGMVLTALPLGFAIAATGLDKLLPSRTTNSFRARVGSIICMLALLCMLIVPLVMIFLVTLLGLLGLGLGLFLPANNAMVMTRLPNRAAATGGGLINMARGLGTALGVALVTLAWHFASPGGEDAGFRAATALLLLTSVVTAFSARELVAPLVSAYDSERGAPNGGREQ